MQQKLPPLTYCHRCSGTGRIESRLLLVEKSGRTRGEIAPHILRLAQERKLNRGLQLAGRRVNRSSSGGNFQAKHGKPAGQLGGVICGWQEAHGTGDGVRLASLSCETSAAPFFFFFHAALLANLIIQEREHLRRSPSANFHLNEGGGLAECPLHILSSDAELFGR